jgi:hypothetical protein
MTQHDRMWGHSPAPLACEDIDTRRYVQECDCLQVPLSNCEVEWSFAFRSGSVPPKGPGPKGIAYVTLHAPRQFGFI